MFNNNTNALEGALIYARAGLKVFPVHHIREDGHCSCGNETCGAVGKHPLTGNGFHNATTDEGIIRRWWTARPQANIGLPAELNGLTIIDVDPKNGGSIESLGLADAEMQTPMQRTQSGGYHIVYRALEGFEVKNNANKVLPGIDIRSRGYIVVAPSRGVRGVYQWVEGKSPFEVEPMELPQRMVSLILASQKRTTPSPLDSPRIHVQLTGEHLADAQEIIDRLAPSGKPYGRAALRNEIARWLATPDGAGRHEALVTGSYSIGGLVEAAEMDADEVKAALVEAGMLMKPDAEEEVIRTVLSGIEKGMQAPREIPDAGDDGELFGTRLLLLPRAAEVSKSERVAVEPKTYHRTDKGNGERLVDKFGDKLRYVADDGRWFHYTGQRWEEATESDLLAYATKALNTTWEEASEIAQSVDRVTREVRAQLESVTSEDEQERMTKELAKLKEKRDEALAWARRCDAVNTRKAAIESATAEDGIAVKRADFDTDPWALNVQNGTLDLRTGELRPHDPRELHTKLAPVVYDRKAKAPVWEEFIHKFTRGNAELAGSLQQLLGYTLTGDTREQKLFYLYGGGANGKSTLFEVLFSLMGDYATRIPSEVLLAGKASGDRKANEIARLPGVRLVVAAELEANRRLDESLVKDLTGDERLSARHLYGKTFIFSPTHKVMMYGNYKATIRGQDEGIWRRLWLIPALYNFTFDPDRVYGFAEKVGKAELSGILNWLLEGVRQWLKTGRLVEPAAVREATKEYRDENDAVAAFLSERCTTGEQTKVRVLAGELYTAYVRWCDESNEYPMNKNEFGRALSAKGFPGEIRGGKQYRLGITMAATLRSVGATVLAR